MLHDVLTQYIWYLKPAGISHYKYLYYLLGFAKVSHELNYFCTICLYAFCPWHITVLLFRNISCLQQISNILHFKDSLLSCSMCFLSQISISRNSKSLIFRQWTYYVFVLLLEYSRLSCRIIASREQLPGSGSWLKVTELPCVCFLNQQPQG